MEINIKDLVSVTLTKEGLHTYFSFLSRHDFPKRYYIVDSDFSKTFSMSELFDIFGKSESNDPMFEGGIITIVPKKDKISLDELREDDDDE